MAQLLRASEFAPALARGCKFDGRLRAPVFLSRTREAARAATRISSGAEDFNESDASPPSSQHLRSAPPAHAQTASVTLYGRLNLDVEVVNGKQGGADCPDNCPNPSQYRVSSNASMFGIRGSEPLGGGLNAIFQVESKLFLDTGGGILAGRESFLGFQSPWGTVKLGFFLSPYDDIQPIFGNAPTLTTSILSTGALWAQAYLGPALAGGFDGRLANSVRYDSPTLAGFNGSVQYSTAEGSPTTNSGIVSVGGFYNNGPVQLGAAYELHHNIRGTVDAPLSDTAFSIAGGYQFEGVRIGGVYERLRYDATPSTDLTRDFYGIGVTVDAGPGPSVRVTGATPGTARAALRTARTSAVSSKGRTPAPRNGK